MAPAPSPFKLVLAVLVRPARAVVGALALGAGQLQPQPHAEQPEQAGYHANCGYKAALVSCFVLVCFSSCVLF